MKLILTMSTNDPDIINQLQVEIGAALEDARDSGLIEDQFDYEWDEKP
jgi:hypothetical protein